MKIIGHRGAAGLALENTIESIRAGVHAGAVYIEMDVRATKDGVLVLCHDESLERTFGVHRNVSECTHAEIKKLCPNLPTLSDALKAAKCEGVIVECKVFIEPKQLLDIFKKFPKLDIRVASFNQEFIRVMKEASNNTFCYVLEHHNWLEVMNRASGMNADGVGINYGVLNLVNYLVAKRKKLHVYTYTVNKRWIAKLYARLYPSAYICTDRPDLLKNI